MKYTKNLNALYLNKYKGSNYVRPLKVTWEKVSGLDLASQFFKTKGLEDFLIDECSSILKSKLYEERLNNFWNKYCRK